MDDVIAAIGTAWGEAAIAVVRLSGGGCVALLDGVFRGRRPLSCEPPRRMALGRIADGDVLVDQVLAVRFPHGASYTGEESCEVHCHGGLAAARRCMDLLLRAGARVALPGEFTKRAFLSGRIDLAQAEAVLGVIRAKSDAALAASNRSLQGELSARLRALMDDLTHLRASLEVRLDYPEEVDGVESGEIAGEVARIADVARALGERCRVGLLLKNGAAVSICGPPNAGKSSLLNALLGEERAIVTALPGTTRDTVDAPLVHRGVPLRLVDTAGIREANDEIERIGIERSRRAMEGADLRLLVLDASAPPTAEAAALADGLYGRPALLVLNKSDLPSVLSDADVEDFSRRGAFASVLRVSAWRGEGIAALKDALVDALLGGSAPDDGYAATERMVDALASALACLREAEEALARGEGIDVAGSLLADASAFLGAPLGADATEELLDSIFANFCVGK